MGRASIPTCLSASHTYCSRVSNSNLVELTAVLVGVASVEGAWQSLFPPGMMEDDENSLNSSLHSIN